MRLDHLDFFLKSCPQVVRSGSQVWELLATEKRLVKSQEGSPANVKTVFWNVWSFNNLAKYGREEVGDGFSNKGSVFLLKVCPPRSQTGSPVPCWEPGRLWSCSRITWQQVAEGPHPCFKLNPWSASRDPFSHVRNVPRLLLFRLQTLPLLLGDLFLRKI